jgi:protein-S-isoprenylcysteine O-methyltransferase Ste14
MYAAALGMLVGAPISLGSYAALIVFAAVSGAIIWRLLDEEEFLSANLIGYVEYRKKVAHRLIPGIW